MRYIYVRVVSLIAMLCQYFKYFKQEIKFKKSQVELRIEIFMPECMNILIR